MRDAHRVDVARRPRRRRSFPAIVCLGSLAPVDADRGQGTSRIGFLAFDVMYEGLGGTCEPTVGVH
jgi:hypothetical protein